jgi:hypothetical protein
LQKNTSLSIKRFVAKQKLQVLIFRSRIVLTTDNSRGRDGDDDNEKIICTTKSHMGERAAF